jgi:hypothetical protein
MIGYIDTWGAALERDVKMMLAGQTVGLYLTQNPSDDSAQSFLHNFIIRNQAIGGTVIHSYLVARTRGRVKGICTIFVNCDISDFAAKFLPDQIQPL